MVALTFDDGLKSVYRYAYPILKQNDQKATLFVISSRVKSKPQKWAPDGLQFMCWPELMQSRDVFDIQSHTHFYIGWITAKPDYFQPQGAHDPAGLPAFAACSGETEP